jgi:hypothetical protein
MKRFSVVLVGLMALCWNADAALAACANGTRWWVVGGDGNWSGSTNWSTSSGGASGASAPSINDVVCFDANSGTGTSVVDQPFQVHSIDFTSGGLSNFTGTLNLNNKLSLPSALAVLGTITLSPSMTVLRLKSF